MLKSFFCKLCQPEDSQKDPKFARKKINNQKEFDKLNSKM